MDTHRIVEHVLDLAVGFCAGRFVHGIIDHLGIRSQSRQDQRELLKEWEEEQRRHGSERQ